MSEVTLYDFWRSSASYRCRIALNLAGLDYTSIPIDLTQGVHKTPEHMARNPQGFVPVLEIDGLRLTQSLAILDYLDQTRDLGLLPKKPAARARMQALAHSIAVDIHPVCNLQVAAYAVEITGNPDMRAQWMRRFIRPGMIAFEALLSAYEQTPFACGSNPTLVDICLMPQVYNARRWGAEIEDLPHTMAAVQACEAHPAFQRAHPDQNEP
ncbi:MAG: maleylacetoacetate isomerase [Aestuariivita sp.]|uniref:maleylacetoacetate isomerase n=1 Tax=Aestuariivita sp. TaxID=1872407 RepID=UPI003BB200CE